MRHQDLVINHKLESWTFANAAARNAPGAYVIGDIGRIAYQNDNGAYYRLTNTTPTWASIVVTYASYQSAQISPSPTALPGPVMMGLGTVATITPSATGKVLLSICGTIQNTVAGKQTNVSITTGTGVAPANGAAGTGTIHGAYAVCQPYGTGSELFPFGLNYLVTGLALGTARWIDLTMFTTGGTGSVGFVVVTAVELP